MYKHSTTYRTLSRRLAALLAALALLAAMALPVYAEALDGATQMQETVETDNNGETDNKVETGSDVETDDKSETNEGTGVGADTESEDTNDNASQNPGANSTTPADNDPADAPDAQDPAAPDTAVAPNPAADAEETTAETTTAEQDVLFADGGNNDVTAPATSGYTLYFIAPTNWEENLSKADAHLYFNVNFHDNEWQQSAMTQIGTTVAGCRLYAINFVPKDGNTTICTCQFQCYVGANHSGQQFQPIANTTTELTSLVGRVFDGTTNAWSDYQKEYAGKTLYFKNDSTAELTSVKAVFYTWDWQSKMCKQVAEQEVGTVAAGAQSEVLIPQTASGFVRFTWTGGQSVLYKYSNIQYTDENTAGNESTPLNITTQNCFIYGADGNVAWGKVSNNVLAAGKTIYFDSTFSSYTYEGEESAIHQNAMPESRNGGSGKIYCFLQKADGSVDTVKMTSATDPKAPDPKAPGRQLWSYTIPKDKSYTAVQFSAWDNKDQTAKDDMTDVLSEDDIPANLKEPCFFADNGDPSAYKDGNPIYREGYWGEKSAVRDAESGKKSTVVDIASEKFTQEPATKYITSTLYDYYTDYELNGFNRDTYPDGNTISQRGFVTFEQFNRALSSAYTSGNVKYPLYTGHFQPSIDGWGNFFADVAKGMNLYGWSEPDHNKEAYINFMAVNNSALDTGLTNTDNNYTKTFQGLMEDKTSDGTKDGLPLLKGTTLVDPHFDKDFLQGKNAFNTVLGKVYEDVSFPLRKEKVFANTQDNSGNNAINDAEYWYFDSNETSLYLKQDSTEGYYLAGDGTNEASRNRGSDNGTNETTNKKFGFFPFNQTVGNGTAPKYNYGFGAKLQFDFTLTENGQVTVGQNGKTVPIQFFFSGDDDVWVYIDGELVLDVGGAHDRAAGLLEFGSDGKGSNTVTSWVSDVKDSGRVYTALEQGEQKTVKFTNKHKISNDYTFKYRTKDPPKTLKKQNIHTLTMYYMERGMWESNMALAFNFPDHNELQVEKKVDVSGVNELFQKSFLDQKIFTFNIQNLATHYGTTPAYTPKIDTKTLPDTAYSKATEPLKHVTTPPVDANKDKAVLWESDKDDPTSANRAERRGTLAWDTAIDIRQYSYLTFDVYVKGESSETCALSNLYVELWDDTGNNKMGCLGTKGLRSSDVYGAATALHPGTWYTVRLMLNSLQKDKDFNNQVTKITVGDNFARSIYLRNFTFSSAPTMPEQTGFTTAQYDIPDYGSAKSGNLENAAYAVFSSNRGTGNVVNENGNFLLQAGEIVTFNDQFRRGSYIALKELTDDELYDTSWTVYENGVPVTNVSGNTNVVTMSDNRSLQNVKGTTPNDGRTEQVVKTSLDGNEALNAYKEAQKPKDTDTLVFRSYSDKADANELTKLKVVYTNKVKTGKLVIRKVPAAGETLKDREFTFTVQFSDVGGQSLGEEIKPQEYTCKVEEHDGSYYGEIVIDKIPVGTRFVVSENPTNGTSLKSVQFKGGKDCAITEDGKRVRGAIVQDSPVTATFENTARELIDITVNKVWQTQDGTVIKDGLPTAIYLRLQRTETPEKENTWLTVPEYENVKLQPKDYQGWIEQFTGLDKYDASKPETDRIPYTYRVLESASGDNNDWHGGVADDVIEIDGKRYKVVNTTASDSSGNITLTLTNQLQDAKYNLVITKQDAQDTNIKLGGVEFKLEKLGTDGKPDTTLEAVKKITSDLDADKGTCRFENLTPGSYRLTETKTAEGYTLLADAIEFTLKTDGHCVRDGADFGKVQYDSGTGMYNIALTINNRKSFELPHTGADAPSLWLLIGLPLAVAGLLILVFRYNKKGGRTR